MVKQQCLFGTLLSIKVPGRHFLFPESWRKGVEIADTFCDRPGSEDDSTDLCGCQRDPWIYIHFVDYSDCILLS